MMLKHINKIPKELGKILGKTKDPQSIFGTDFWAFFNFLDKVAPLRKKLQTPELKIQTQCLNSKGKVKGVCGPLLAILALHEWASSSTSCQRVILRHEIVRRSENSLEFYLSVTPWQALQKLLTFDYRLPNQDVQEGSIHPTVPNVTQIFVKASLDFAHSVLESANASLSILLQPNLQNQLPLFERKKQRAFQVSTQSHYLSCRCCPGPSLLLLSTDFLVQLSR